ncbi:transporter, partial [Bosea sp. 2YAB26]
MTGRRTGCGRFGLRVALAISIGLASSFAIAQEGPEKSTDDLAKAAQNPVADMISLPFQNNSNFNVGPHKQLQNVLNIQPVIPITLNKDWNLITRWITPVISQPALTVNGDREFGLGDINPSFFFSPKQPTHG